MRSALCITSYPCSSNLNLLADTDYARESTVYNQIFLLSVFQCGCSYIGGACPKYTMCVFVAGGCGELACAGVQCIAGQGDKEWQGEGVRSSDNAGV